MNPKIEIKFESHDYDDLVDMMKRILDDQLRPPSAEEQLKERRALAAEALSKLKPEDLDPELQVDLFNRLVELMAAK